MHRRARHLPTGHAAGSDGRRPPPAAARLIHVASPSTMEGQTTRIPAQSPKSPRLRLRLGLVPEAGSKPGGALEIRCCGPCAFVDALTAGPARRAAAAAE